MPRVIAGSLLLSIAACTPLRPGGQDADPIAAAYVVLGERGQPIARVVTSASVCPPLIVDGVALAMSVRAAPATLPLRPTLSAPTDSKPSAFPLLICELAPPAGARSATVGAHSLPLPKSVPNRIVVIGDTGCRIKKSDNAFQACNDVDNWPFAQVAASAAAMKPDLVIHVGDFQYRETACPEGNAGCAGSPWGYGWDTWDADLFTPARALLAAAPWIVVRGNHESCNRAGQGWWRLLDPRPLAPGRDCVDPAADAVGDFSSPYAVPIGPDSQLIVFDSSKVGVTPLATTDPMYQTYSAQMQQVFALTSGVAHNFFMEHHPILGFAPDTTKKPTGVYPGNPAMQSVLQPINAQLLFPPNVQALIAGHVHLFEMVSFATPQPSQLISGNSGSWADARLPLPLPRDAMVSPGAVIESIVSTSQYGFTTIERNDDGTWRIRAWDRHGQALTTCTLRGSKTNCAPEKLP